MRDICPKCGGEVYKINKDIVKDENLICKKCGELYNSRNELKNRCCD